MPSPMSTTPLRGWIVLVTRLHTILRLSQVSIMRVIKMFGLGMPWMAQKISLAASSWYELTKAQAQGEAGRSL